MSETARKLRKNLARLRRRERAVRWVTLSGRFFLGAAVLSLAVVLVRRYLLETRGIEILPLSPLEFLYAAVGVVLLPPVLVRLALWIRRPALESVASFADRKLDLRDLLASGLAAVRLPGLVPGEVVRRAAVAAGRVRPASLYPASRTVAKTIGKVVLLLAGLYLIGLPGGAGWIPIPGGDGGGALSGDGVARQPGGDPEADDFGGEGANAEGEGDGEDEVPGEVPDQIVARVLPAKKVYEEGEPILVFVTASPGEPMKRAHSLEAMLAVDGEVAAIDETLIVRPGEAGGAVHLVEDARKVRGLGDRLGAGKHVLSAVLIEDGEAYLSEPVEIEIRGGSDGGGGGGEPEAEPEPDPEPEPQAGGEPPPPPEFEGVPRFVTPLFRDGETVKKEGYALVPDPDTPSGAPPRRLPLSRAAREAVRRPESPVHTERLSAADRETVVEYFDRLRDGK